MKYLYFDLRALALMRIAIAMVIMFDISIRICDLEAFYTNSGIAPLSMIFEHAWNKYYFSLHTISGLWLIELLLFFLAFFFAVMLFIGYRTRLFTVLSWLMLLSLHNRNIFILQGGDDLLRLVLFWAMFIPWGSRYSCDSLLNSEKQQSREPVLTVATIAYLLQVSYIYTGSALLKGDEWNADFTALYYAYSLDQITFPLSRAIYYYPELLKKLTFFVYYFELLIPLLFFIPFRHALFRTIAVIVIICFHTFNSLSLLIGLFPAIGIATISGILPSPAMDYLDRRFHILKNKVAQSFTSYAQLLSRLIEWKQPKQITNPLLEKIISVVLCFLIVFVFNWNFSNLSFATKKLSGDFKFIGYSLRLDQSWDMFSPGVFKDDGWYVLKGTTADNRDFNLLDSAEKVNFKKPDYVADMFKNDRWRKYSENYLFYKNDFMRNYFCTYTLRKWNKKYPEKKIKKLLVIYMKELTLPDYQYSRPVPEALCSCKESTVSKIE